MPLPNNFWLLGIHAITGSHYDHAAIVIRFGETLKDLYLLEVVYARGVVRMTLWLRVREQLYPAGFFEKVVTIKLLYGMTT